MKTEVNEKRAALISARRDLMHDCTDDLQRDHERRIEDITRHFAQRRKDIQRRFAQDWETASRLCYAYQEGVKAFFKGRPIEKNPFPEDTGNWAEWNQGWTDASKIKSE